jgi:hypothetical protein
VAVLSLLTEVALSGVQRVVTPAGLRRRPATPKIAAVAPIDPSLQVA